MSPKTSYPSTTSKPQQGQDSRYTPHPSPPAAQHFYEDSYQDQAARSVSTLFNNNEDPKNQRLKSPTWATRIRTSSAPLRISPSHQERCRYFRS